MPTTDRIVVFVHGWSVHNTKTYGEFPARLEREAAIAGDLRVDVHQIWLSEYVSFSDAVRMSDLVRAFDAAIHRELKDQLARGQRFVCITHSTGGPVVREWWHRYWRRGTPAGGCPLSHLIMLAPANFGSALAQLGKGRLSRIKSWFEGIEPGTGVLDWLELGSPEAWDLNQEWIRLPDPTAGSEPVFSFVLTGQSIDRKLYDPLNTYTGQAGSDGVVRTAAANLNATWVRVEQTSLPETVRTEQLESPRTAFALIKGRSHTGKDMGILESIRDDGQPHPTVAAVLACLRVCERAQYQALCARFDEQNKEIREAERIDRPTKIVALGRTFFNDAHAMVIFRVVDDQGLAVEDFDLVLGVAVRGTRLNPNRLPAGFSPDRQKNRRHAGTLTFYLNHDVMAGLEPTVDRSRNEVLRLALRAAPNLGFSVTARPDEGFVRFTELTVAPSKELLASIVKPDQTTLVEVVLRRIIDRGVFALTQAREPTDFRKTALSGKDIDS